jgi:hypothetical protein
MDYYILRERYLARRIAPLQFEWLVNGCWIKDHHLSMCLSDSMTGLGDYSGFDYDEITSKTAEKLIETGTAMINEKTIQLQDWKEMSKVAKINEEGKARYEKLSEKSKRAVAGEDIILTPEEEYVMKIQARRLEDYLAIAIQIATDAHKGQIDKSGADYILHPLRVMERGKTDVEKICGVLHDVIEDSDWTFDALANEGFSGEIISVLRCLTKESEDENYDTFIDRVKQNPIAVQVKINDLLDNLDVTRLKELNESDLKRLNKYQKAYQKLRECQNN